MDWQKPQPCIYKITNNLNHKVYIGATDGLMERRWEEHKKCARLGVKKILYDAMRADGVENFSIRSSMYAREKVLICEMNTLCPNGYNVHPGRRF